MRPDLLAECRNVPGWMDDDELIWLHDRASRMRSVVEVGSWKGRSSYALLSACTGPVFCVDHFEGSPSETGDGNFHAEAKAANIYEQFRTNVARFSNVMIVRKDSVLAARAFAAAGSLFDMVFIDGEHTAEAVKRDLDAWRPLARRLLCGHDRFHDGVKAVLEQSGVAYRDGPGSLWYQD
jgi:hypothetical protein